MSVVVLGDANIDLEVVLPTDDRGTVHANPDPRAGGGGSAANTAAALARLGVECRFVGAVGDDGYGRLAVAALADAGVDTSGITVDPAEPTVVVIVVVPADGNRLIYVWPPTGGAHRALAESSALRALQGATWLHVSGISLRVSPARESIMTAMEQARDSQIPVSLDLNLRLENWGWDAGFRGVVDAAVARADVVLGAARDEICPYAGIDDPARAAAKVAGDRRLVIARLGADGALACSASEVTTAGGFSVPVVDTVGAGDAFNAGFIAARLEGAGVEESVRWGNAVAALTITRPGARATPTRSDVVALLE